jgi:serine/threonine-protein kinase
MDQHVTIVRPEEEENSQSPRASVSLPVDLLSQAAARLRILALLYAFVFFMADIFPMLVVGNDRSLLLNNFVQWGPPSIAIVFSLLVAWVIRSPRVSLSTAMRIGVVFQVVSCFGIAIAELIDIRGYQGEAQFAAMHGLSWVAVWILLFTIVIPSPPRRALIAALASIASLPITTLVLMRFNLTIMRPDSVEIFFWMILPYLLVVGMAYVGARVVYHLGSEVKRARELGSYHLEEKLGQGGMGEVWRARHRLLARPAAIKLMRTTSRNGEPAGLSQDSVHRFEREAQVIASLRSPHTVNLFDFGVATDGSFYYVMELLEGLDTDKLVRRFGPLPASRVIHLLKQVCHSLSEAESHGLVHRDIKPANIFLCRYGEDYDFVKVLDFGIVKASPDSPTPISNQNLTADNALHGTPAFMAPEQVMGEAVDGRADIYATGCVAYWLLTGQLVFDAPSPMGLLVHHTQSKPRRPSTRTELAIPTALDDLVLSCLAKDPAERPRSARELARRLSLLPGAGEWNDERAREWWEKVRL